MTTDQPLDLDAIEAVADAATPGPWTVDSSIPYGHRVGSSDEADWVAWTGEHGETGSEADAAFIAAVNPVVALALVAEVRRLRVELERRTEDLAFLERTTLPELRREIEHHKAGKQRWRDRAEKAEAALTAIRHLHKDSPMGPCPVCIDADAVAAGGDGLVPYPCPTARLSGAQDCNPPHTPTSVRP